MTLVRADGDRPVHPDTQAAYALVSARIDLLMAELREALDRHEAARRWGEHEALARVERGLAEVVKEIE